MKFWKERKIVVSKRRKLNKVVRYGSASEEQIERAKQIARERDRKNGRRRKEFFRESA